MTTNINFDELRKDANEIFHSGFTCSESVIYTIRKAFDLDMSDDAIKMSSGFPWGLGGGGCICRTETLKISNVLNLQKNSTIILKKPAEGPAAVS